MFQSYALFPHMSVAANVGFGLKMRKVDRTDAARRVERALDLVQLRGLGERYPRELSGGQQQRVALARAIVIEPAVLLLDEPLSNLDASLREQMRFEIREIQKRIGITTIFVTHDQTEALAVADRLVVMAAGQIRQLGTPSEIYESPVDRFVAGFIGQANLLQGTLRSCDGGFASIQIPASDDTQHIKVKTRMTASAGAPVTLALRPEDVTLESAARAGQNCLRGTVKRAAYLGAHLSVTVEASNQEFVVKCPRSHQSLRIDDEIHVCWPYETGFILQENV
jgi:iron(III) transport system ATP-binding protein